MRRFITVALLLVCGVAYAGYDVHITRKSLWSEDTGPKISFTEWLAYVRTDPQVAQDPRNTADFFIVTLPGETLPLWFEPETGDVSTKDPSDHAVSKLVEIAKHLHARVQGDDGEFYP